MREVLQAFTLHNPDIGYCQGFNFIAAVFLLLLTAEDAFWSDGVSFHVHARPCLTAVK